MHIKVCLSSKSDEWETPDKLYDVLNKEFNFNLDPACRSYNQKAPNGFCIDNGIDGLKEDWWPYKSIFLNPPYGRSIYRWIKKAYEESQKGCVVVCLIPSRTDTRYWHEFCVKGEIRFIKGRLKFINRTLPSYRGNRTKLSSAPFPSAIIIFRKNN